MDILVCVKRVPDTAGNEIEVNGDKLIEHLKAKGGLK